MMGFVRENSQGLRTRVQLHNRFHNRYRGYEEVLMRLVDVIASTPVIGPTYVSKSSSECVAHLLFVFLE